MITIIGRRLIIPDCDRILGVVGDKNTPVKIKLSENTLESYLPGAKSFGDVAIILKLEHETTTVTVPPILCVHDKEGVYVGDLSILSSVKSGLVSAQAMIVLPGSATDDTALDDAESIWQSDEDYFYIADDIELKSFSDSSDTYNDFQNLLAAVAKNVVAAESEKKAAETAKEAAETAESNAEGAEERINEAVTSFNEAYGDFSLQAEKAKEHYDSGSNPHEVTAKQVGAYTKEEVDKKLGEVNVNVDLSEYVKNTDYASADKGGVIRIRNDTYGLQIGANDGIAFIKKATDAEINAKTQAYKPIVPANLEYAVKSVGDGYYITDTDYATGSKGGVGKISTNFGILVNTNGYFYPMVASEEEIDAGTHKYHIVAPSNLKYAVAKGGEGHFAKEDAVFETGSFGWTDFETVVPDDDMAGLMGEISDNTISISGTGYPVIIHCAGKTLGFTFSIRGYSDAYLKINGITTTYTNPAYDGSEFATNIVIPPTYMESDVEFSGGMNVWTFTDMTIQSIKGVSVLEEQIGDIDTALDSILAIQNALIGGDA